MGVPAGSRRLLLGTSSALERLAEAQGWWEKPFRRKPRQRGAEPAVVRRQLCPDPSPSRRIPDRAALEETFRGHLVRAPCGEQGRLQAGKPQLSKSLLGAPLQRSFPERARPRRCTFPRLNP